MQLVGGHRASERAYMIKGLTCFAAIESRLRGELLAASIVTLWLLLLPFWFDVQKRPPSSRGCHTCWIIIISALQSKLQLQPRESRPSARPSNERRLTAASSRVNLRPRRAGRLSARTAAAAIMALIKQGLLFIDVVVICLCAAAIRPAVCLS